MSTTKRVILGVLAVIVLGISGCLYSITRGPWVVWDEHDPKLHGQKISFNVPMVYMTITQEHTDNYQEEEIAIGRVLEPKESYECRGCSKDMGYKAESVPEGGVFTITRSYWDRLNSWERSFAGDLRKLVLVDENGIESILLFLYLGNSDRPDFQRLENDGALQ